MLPNCICSRKHRLGREIGRKILKSLLTDPDWKLDYGAFTKGLYSITTYNREVEIECNNMDLWIPLILRLRIRCAIRYRCLLEAQKDTSL